MKTNHHFLGLIFLAMSGSVLPLAAGLDQGIAAVSVSVKGTTSPPFFLPEFSDAALPLTWEVLVGPATVVGNLVTMTGTPGAVTLRATQAGNASYDAAEPSYVTFLVDVGGGYEKLAAGETFVVSIKSDGALWAWGSNRDGQLGDGTTTGHAIPALVTVPTNELWTDVSCGRGHAVARRADGSLWAWGANSDGQLGLGNTVNRHFPTRIGTQTNWAGVACGSNHTLAWKSDGSLWAWGDNLQGQLGDGTIADRSLPVRVGTASDWVQAVGGSAHTVARRAGGSIWTWGLNASGQLGDNTTTRKLSPVRVGTDSDWVDVSAGFIFSAGRRSNGSVWTWGHNSSGQLGLGHRALSLTPQQVGSDLNWARIYSGASCMMAIKDNGSLWAWGDNSAGQLGDQSVSDQLSPVATLDGPWSSVTLGAACALGVRSGVVWSWGTNDFEQLGLPAGVTAISSVPPGARLPRQRAQTVVAPPLIAGLNLPFPVSVGSALPPVVEILSGPGAVSPDGEGVIFVAEGTVAIRVSHPGDHAWLPAGEETFIVEVDGTGPVFNPVPESFAVSLQRAGGSVVSHDVFAEDSVTGSATVICVPASGSLLPGGITTVNCRADDGLGNFTTVAFEVKVNRVPVPIPDSVTTVANEAKSILLESSDADEGLGWMSGATTNDLDRAYVIVTPPAHGQLSGVAPNLVYTPATGYVGPDQFTFTVSDGFETSLEATVAIDIPVDSDGDDLPDLWELEHFGSLSNDGGGDSDGDGQSNGFEFLSGTLPGDAGNRFTFAPMVADYSSGAFQLSHVRSGVVYRLEVSADLMSWDLLAEVTFEFAGSGILNGPVTGAPAPDKLFYRVGLDSAMAP